MYGTNIAIEISIMNTIAVAALILAQKLSLIALNNVFCKDCQYLLTKSQADRCKLGLFNGGNFNTKIHNLE